MAASSKCDGHCPDSCNRHKVTRGAETRESKDESKPSALVSERAWEGTTKIRGLSSPVDFASGIHNTVVLYHKLYIHLNVIFNDKRDWYSMRQETARWGSNHAFSAGADPLNSVSDEHSVARKVVSEMPRFKG
jgi:hypothetical protein